MRIGSYLEITEEEIKHLGKTVEEIQEDLTLPNPAYEAKARFGKGKYVIREPKELCYLKKRGDKYILPRNYFGIVELLSVASTFDDNRIKGREIAFKHKITLRDYQEKFFEENKVEIAGNYDVIFNMPTGHGKSICAIYHVHEVGKQALILVPTYYLAQQWKKLIETVTDASVYVMNTEDKEIPLDSDFTIALMETLTVRELPVEFINNVGHLILDEAHRVGCQSYLPLLDLFPALNRTALTATFRRADGTHAILRYHFGELLTMKNMLPKPKMFAVQTGIEVKGVLSKNRPTESLLNFLDLNFNSEYHETKSAVSFDPKDKIIVEAERQQRLGIINKTECREIISGVKHAKDISYTVMESYLNTHSGRRKIIIRVIQEALDAGRSVLFLSKRKDILSAMNKYFAKYRPMLVISETNKRSQEEEEYLQTKCRLVLGIAQLAKEGMDIPHLDTLVTYNIADLQQAIGRISRLHAGKQYPMIFYILDNFAIAYSTFTKAVKSIDGFGDYISTIRVPTIKMLLE